MPNSSVNIPYRSGLAKGLRVFMVFAGLAAIAIGITFISGGDTVPGVLIAAMGLFMPVGAWAMSRGGYVIEGNELKARNGLLNSTKTIANLDDVHAAHLVSNNFFSPSDGARRQAAYLHLWHRQSTLPTPRGPIASRFLNPKTRPELVEAIEQTTGPLENVPMYMNVIANDDSQALFAELNRAGLVSIGELRFPMARSESLPSRTS